MASFLERAARARALSDRHPEAREALVFYAEVAELQHRIDRDQPLRSLPDLVALTERTAPGPLRWAAREIDEESCRRFLEEASSPRSFFARVLYQAAEERPKGMDPDGCPRCAHPPQAGCLRLHGDGTALYLCCSLCSHEWPASRDRCSRCGGTLQSHETPSLPQIRVSACESCHRYLHVVRIDRDPEAIPLVDEIAALALDVWARGEGYEKIFPNLVGI